MFDRFDTESFIELTIQVVFNDERVSGVNILGNTLGDSFLGVHRPLVACDSQSRTLWGILVENPTTVEMVFEELGIGRSLFTLTLALSSNDSTISNRPYAILMNGLKPCCTPNPKKQNSKYTIICGFDPS